MALHLADDIANVTDLRLTRGFGGHVGGDRYAFVTP